MRVTVIPADMWIRRDDVEVNLLAWPFDDSDIHAIQWDEAEGEIEYTGKPKPPNQSFTDATLLDPYLTALEDRLVEIEAETAALQAEYEAQQAAEAAAAAE